MTNPTVRKCKRNTTLKLVIPTTEYEALTEKLSARGSSLMDYVQLSLRALGNSPRTLDLNDIIDFGKYKGAVLETVIRADPSYIQWFLRATTRRITDAALDLLETTSTIERQTP